MGANMKTSVLDVEHLQQMSYIRSRKWSLFLDSINDSEGEILKIDELDLVLPEEEAENSDGMASMEDDNDVKSLDTDVLRDITNSLHIHNNTLQLTEATIVPDDENEIVDILNQTLPVLNEHHRQLKESGLERILNTFDAKKIEEKVGGWLRRHNSLCTPYHPEVEFKQNQVVAPHCDLVATDATGTTARTLKNCRIDDTDSVDSFQSGETARYIRSSRAGAIKNSSSPTMMIKTYRKVKSSRQALRAKYACAFDEDAELHLNKLRHKRRLAYEVENRRAIEKYWTKSYNSMALCTTPSHGSCIKKKRRVLRKRSVSNSCSAKDTSSDSDSSYNTRGTANKFHQQKHKLYKHHYKTTTERHAVGVPASVGRSQCRHFVATTAQTSSVKRLQYMNSKKDSCSRSKECYYCEHNISDSSLPSSSSPLSSPLPPSSKICRKWPYKCGERLTCNDYRPLKYESKCRCVKEKRLCQKYRRLSDLSTDEWIVETSFTRNRMIVPHSNQRLCAPRTQKPLSITGIAALTDDSTVMSTSIPCAKPTPATSETFVTKCLKTTNQPSQSNEEEELKYSDDSSFERELQLALSESKKLAEKKLTQYPDPENSAQEPMHSAAKPKTKKAKSKKTPPLGKPSIKRDLIEDTCSASNKTQQKSDKLNLLKEDEALNIQQTPSSSKSINNKNESKQISEDTFFATCNRVCNSTALQNKKTACARQILSKTDELTDDAKLVKVLEEKGEHVGKGETPRPKKNSTKLKKSTQPNDDFIFVMPQGRDNKTLNSNSATKPRTNAKVPSLAVNGNNSNDRMTQRNVPVVFKSETQNVEDAAILQEFSSGQNSSETKLLNSSNSVNGLQTKKKAKPKKNKINSNVSSTTFQSPDLEIYLQPTKKRSYQHSNSVYDENENDCTIVSSTTNVDAHFRDSAAESDKPSTSRQSTALRPESSNSDEKINMSRDRKYLKNYHPTKGILIYTPQKASYTASARSDGFFHITKAHLSGVLGEKPAEKFLKYYSGRRRFNSNSTVYYKPPATRERDTSSSDSDDDLERMGKYGHLYASDGTSD